MIPFEDPWLFLLAAPAVVASLRRARRPTSFPIHSHILLEGIAVATWRTRLWWLPAAMRGLAIVLVVAAAARPFVQHSGRGSRSTNGAWMLVLDISGSMATRDSPGGLTRLERMKRDIRECLQSNEPAPAPIGVVSVSEFPGITCPPTSDRRAVLAAVAAMEVDHLGDRTNLGDAIGLAIDRIRGSGNGGGRLLVYSDGAHNVEESMSPTEAARVAESLGIRIDAVVAGPWPAEETEAAGDVQRLMRLCELTGGTCFSIDDLASSETFRGFLDSTGTGDTESRMSKQGVFAPMLVAALMVLLLEAWLRRAVFGFLDEPSASSVDICERIDT